MNTLGALAGLVLLVVAIYFGKQEFSRREREAFRRTVVRSTETLADLKEHAQEFNKKEVLKVSFTAFRKR